MLFTIVDEKAEKVPVQFLLLKTVIVYIAFVMMTKSKWYFSLPVLMALVLDQMLKYYSDYLKMSGG